MQQRLSKAPQVVVSMVGSEALLRLDAAPAMDRTLQSLKGSRWMVFPKNPCWGGARNRACIYVYTDRREVNLETS